MKPTTIILLGLILAIVAIILFPATVTPLPKQMACYPKTCIDYPADFQGPVKPCQTIDGIDPLRTPTKTANRVTDS